MTVLEVGALVVSPKSGLRSNKIVAAQQDWALTRLLRLFFDCCADATVEIKTFKRRLLSLPLPISRKPEPGLCGHRQHPCR